MHRAARVSLWPQQLDELVTRDVLADAGEEIAAQLEHDFAPSERRAGAVAPQRERPQELSV
jgi:hypothetical protein